MPKKILAKGYTTGTCAQAATKAAMQMLFTGEKVEKISVELPQGERLQLDIVDIRMEYKEDESLPEEVTCAVKKNSGDDPDITNGVLVYSKVKKNTLEVPEEGQCEKQFCEAKASNRKKRAGQKKYDRIHIDGGTGIGRVTKPGLNQPVGEAAINRVPRQMIRKEVEEACEEVGYTGGIDVVISIPEGVRLAKETFNPRLGIEGGLSVLGTTGIVNPMSEQALIDTIEVEMKVCLAEKYRYLIVAPGNYGLDFLKEQYSIEENDVVKCSNYIGQTIDMAMEQGCKGVLLAGHIGKLIKVAGGIMNTHSRWADCRMDLFATAALRAGIDGKKARAFLDCVTTDDALKKCSEEERKKIMEQLMIRMEEYLNYRTKGEMEIGVVTFSNVYGILGKTGKAEELIYAFVKERS